VGAILTPFFCKINPANLLHRGAAVYIMLRNSALSGERLVRLFASIKVFSGFTFTNFFFERRVKTFPYEKKNLSV
jgi:hypothetical protein